MFSYVTLDNLQNLKVLCSVTDHLELQHSGTGTFKWSDDS